MRLHSEALRDAWLDAYGHLNEAYYLVPFSNATWALQDHFGVGVAYFDQTGCALYTVETHLRYLKEVRAPATFDIESIVLETDAKRIRFAHTMFVDASERATFECLVLHFDTRNQRTVPLPDAVQKALQAACVASLPEWAGRNISLHRR
ncbi:MAG: thioesterase family protein [Gammaproteobacteria bacterium]|nr:thioesterase family protein [Gammaproteobacteria bacterium]